MYLPYIEWKTLYFTYSTNILVRLLIVNMKNSLTPQIRKFATPLLSIRVNATPSSGTSPLAPYKEVPPRVTSVCYFWEGLKPETLEE